MDNKPVSLTLTHDEALVLFELLSRYDDTEQLSVDVPAEELALWRLHGALQRILVAPLQPDYNEQLQQARQRLCPGTDDA